MTHTLGVLRIAVNLSGSMKDSGISPYNPFFLPKACLLEETVIFSSQGEPKCLEADMHTFVMWLLPKLSDKHQLW